MNASLSANANFMLPSHWKASASAQLSPHENVLAWLEVDLDAQLQFVKGLLIVTDQHILSASHGANGPEWQSWDLQSGWSMEHFDYAGVGTLSLRSRTEQIAAWRFTLTHNLLAMRLQEAFAARIEVLTHGHALQLNLKSRCPQCKLPLETQSDECPVCNRETHEPLSTWGLFRLWRFAKPYRWRLLLGFLLTLASTAATLVPPYLTMPLMDDEIGRAHV